MSIGFASFVYYFLRMHNLIIQPQLQAVSDLVNKVMIQMMIRGMDMSRECMNRRASWLSWLFPITWQIDAVCR